MAFRHFFGYISSPRGCFSGKVQRNVGINDIAAVVGTTGSFETDVSFDDNRCITICVNGSRGVTSCGDGNGRVDFQISGYFCHPIGKRQNAVSIGIDCGVISVDYGFGSIFGNCRRFRVVSDVDADTGGIDGNFIGCKCDGSANV